MNQLPSCEDHSVLSTCTIAEQSDKPTPRKGSKTTILALICIIYANYAQLSRHDMSDMMRESLETFG